MHELSAALVDVKQVKPIAHGLGQEIPDNGRRVMVEIESGRGKSVFQHARHTGAAVIRGADEARTRYRNLCARGLFVSTDVVESGCKGSNLQTL